MTQAGPVSCAKILLGHVSDDTFSIYDSFLVRLYGGWRANGTSSRSAQRIVPSLQRESPTVIPARPPLGNQLKRLVVELAEGPIGSHTTFDETLVPRRGLRRFRAEPSCLSQCNDVGACSMRSFYGLTSSTECANPACPCVLGDLLVRDEQKMVDTLLVTDIAQMIVQRSATKLVLVSSDADMWPGVYLALRSGCEIIQIHTRGGQTQGHLLRTLEPRLSALYKQTSL
jgi:hypothetical protein